VSHSTVAAATAAGTLSGESVPSELFGHPRGLFVCFFTEMWERFSFYGMKALLLLYMLKHHMFSDQLGYLVLGAYAGLVYAMPVIGGMIADRVLGMRRAVIFGGILLVFGHAGMAWEGEAAHLVGGAVVRDETALTAFYVSLSLIICGVGFLKPNIASIVGLLYKEGDARRDSGFTIYYAGINLGSLFSSLICGYVGEKVGWNWGFGLAGGGMVLGLLVFITGQRHLQGLAESPNPERLLRRVAGPVNVERAIYLGTILAVILVALLLQIPKWVGKAQFAMIAVWLAWFVWYVARRCDRVQRGRMISLLFFVSFVLLFFTLYEQSYASWVTLTDRLLEKDLFPTLALPNIERLTAENLSLSYVPWSVLPLVASPLVAAWALARRNAAEARLAIGVLAFFSFGFIMRDAFVLPQTAGSLTYVGALFIVLLSPIFSWLWPALERKGWNPRKSVKCVIGLALAGVSSLPLLWGSQIAAGGHKASVWWLVLAYLVIEMGEIVLSPITLAAISELSVQRVLAVMMSAWLLATSVSETAAAGLSSFASLEIQPGEQLDFAAAAAKYVDLFQMNIWIGLASALVALLCVPLLRRLMHGLR
jgi:POT family proton-dependent oligopeptide transporter